MIIGALGLALFALAAIWWYGPEIAGLALVGGGILHMLAELLYPLRVVQDRALGARRSPPVGAGTLGVVFAAALHVVAGLALLSGWPTWIVVLSAGLAFADGLQHAALWLLDDFSQASWRHLATVVPVVAAAGWVAVLGPSGPWWLWWAGPALIGGNLARVAWEGRR